MREYAIVCALVRCGGDLRMVRQAGPGEEPAWTVACGQIEDGETEVDALVREVSEEAA